MSLALNPLLDTDYLRSFFGNDPIIIHMIFDAFLQDSVPRWNSLYEAIEINDLSMAASIVHGLKPSFTMSGLTTTRLKVDRLERQIKEKADLAEIRASYEAINKDLKDLIPILVKESARLKLI